MGAPIPAPGERPGYLTLAEGQEAVGEFEDRRSRFIAQLRHVTSEREAEAFVGEIRSRHRDARHNVPAWALSDGREKRSDDGEPQGTAGQPTLDVLRGEGLSDVCCVVTRYFGGTLLGPGGLKRAYTEATKRAVAAGRDQGILVRMGLVTRVTACIPYAAYGRAERLVEECGGRVRDTAFSEDVQMDCSFPAGQEAAFVAAMRELMAGEDVCLVGQPRFEAL